MINKLLLMLVILFCSFMGISQTNDSPKKSGAELMRELRLRILNTPASELKIQPNTEFPRVYAILMDWPLNTNTVTVFSSCIGDASIYTTSSFGVIGGIGHESVRVLAKEFVKAGERHYEDSATTKEYPYPKSGHVYFYLVCFDGVRMIDRQENDLRVGSDKCADLYSAGHRVLTELRIVTDKKKK